MLRRTILGAAAVTSLVAAAPAVAAPQSLFNRFHHNQSLHQVHVTRTPNWSGLTKVAQQHRSSLAPVGTPYTPKPAVYPGAKGFPCSVPADSPTMTTDDSENFEQHFKVNGTMELSITQTCSGSTGTAGTPSVAPDCTLGGVSLGAYATFADGEYVDSCSLPGTDLATLYAGSPVAADFRCEATIGTGPDGNKAMNLHTLDSVEYFLVYQSNAAPYPLFSITTSCVGKVPAGTAISPKIKTHVVKCKEVGPFGIVYASGVSTVFPDGQYSETCTQPAQPL